jgi:hypothetical protein
VIPIAVWNGRRDYARELPQDIMRWVGGDKIAIVQVDSPVGINRRSSLDLTHKLAKDFVGVPLGARQRNISVDSQILCPARSGVGRPT